MTAVERQEADCRAWAAGQGLAVRQVHVDRGRSGFKDVTRKGFEAARRAVTSGAVRTLLAGDAIVVVESARHRLTRLRLPDEAVKVAEVAHRTQREATEVAPGRLALDVIFQAPAGQKLDTRYGPSTCLLVSSTPPELLRDGEGAGTDLSRALELDPAVPEGVLHVSAMAASCDDDPDNAYPACHVHQQDWGVPVRLHRSGNGPACAGTGRDGRLRTSGVTPRIRRCSRHGGGGPPGPRRHRASSGAPPRAGAWRCC
ncbi:recombinase family protein [Streptomyces massasporeus]|uniref:recombinase family protein n=1 Tax=Streptomyces massasporeus TaxID=67324 RepID=UPI0033CEF5EA